MHSLGIVQWNSTRRDHPGNPGGVFGSGPVSLVSEPIPDLDVGVCSVWPRNPMGHNEGVVSAWGGVCHIPHRIGEKLPGTI